MNQVTAMRPTDRILDVSHFTPAAHRGACRECPENTLEAFARALEILPGCLLETDVRCSADGVPLLRHDRLLEETTNGTGETDSLKWDELCRLDAGYNITFDGGKTFPFRGKGFRLCTLDQALERFPGDLFSIDIKVKSIEFTERVLEVIRRHRAEGRVIVGSFFNLVTGHLRRSYGDLTRHAGFTQVLAFIACSQFGMTGSFHPLDHAFFVPEYHFGRSPEYRGRCSGIRVITRRFIDDAHRRGVPVFAWTIDEKENMRRLVQWGVNGIVTNYPGRLKEILMEEGRSW